MTVHSLPQFLRLWFLALLVLLGGTSAKGMAKVSGWCEQSSPPIVGPVTRTFMQSFPRCTVNVYITGSGGTHANIYSTNGNPGTVLSNPFTASASGRWEFYTPDGYIDVQISGSGIAVPFTFGGISVIDAYYDPPSPLALGADEEREDRSDRERDGLWREV